MAFVQKRTYGEIKRSEAKGTRDNSINAKTTYGEIKAREKEQKPYEPSEYDQGGSFIDYLLGRSKNKELQKRADQYNQAIGMYNFGANVLNYAAEKQNKAANQANQALGMYDFGANALNYAANGMNEYYKEYAERRQKMLEEQYRQQQANVNAINSYSQWTPKGLMDPKLAELRALIPEKTTGQQPTAAPKTQGVYGKGNINLNSRQKVLNPDGTFSTEESFSTNIDGEEVLLPTVIDGKHVSEQEAIDHYRQTGEYLGKFATPDEATEYAERLHKLQEKYYSGDQRVNNPLINNAREQLLQDPGYKTVTRTESALDRDVSHLSNEAQRCLDFLRNAIRSGKGDKEIKAATDQAIQLYGNDAYIEALPYANAMMAEYRGETNPTHNYRTLTRPFDEQSRLEMAADPNSKLHQTAAFVQDWEQQKAKNQFLLMLEASDAQDRISGALTEHPGWLGGQTEAYKTAMSYDQALQDMQTIERARKAGLYNYTGDPAQMNTKGRNALKKQLTNENKSIRAIRIPEDEKALERIQEELNRFDEEVPYEKRKELYGKEYRAFLESEGYTLDEEWNVLDRNGYTHNDDPALNFDTYIEDTVKGRYRDRITRLENNIAEAEATIRNNEEKLKQIDRYNDLEENRGNIMNPENAISKREQLQTEIDELDAQIRAVEAQRVELHTAQGEDWYGDWLATEDRLMDLQKQKSDKEDELAEIGEAADLGTVYEDSTYHPEYYPGKDTYLQKIRGKDAPPDNTTSDIDRIVSWANGGEERGTGDWEISHDYHGAMAMFPEEIEQLTAYYNAAKAENREPTEAKAFLEALQPYLNQRLRIYEEISNKQTAMRLPGLSSVASLAMTATEPYLAIGTGIGLLTGDRAVQDPYSWLFSTARAQQDIESQVASDLGGLGGFVYQAGMSGLKNFVRGLTTIASGAAAPAINLLEFAGEAFYTSYQKTLEETGDTGVSAASALLDAGISTLFEVASVEKLYSDPGSMMTYILQNMGAEMSEEFFEGVFRPYIQRFFQGTDDIEKRADQIIADGGYTDESGNWVTVNKENAKEAALQAAREHNIETAKSVLSAGISTGGNVMFAATRNFMDDSKLGKEALNKGKVKGMSWKDVQGLNIDNALKLAEPASMLPEGTQAKKYADNLLQQMQNGEKISRKDVGKLVKAIWAESNEEIGKIAKDTLGEDFMKRLKAAGESQENAAQLSSILTNMITTGEISMKDALKLTKSEEANRILNEYDTSEEKKAFEEKTKAAREASNSVMEMFFVPNAEQISEEQTAQTMEGAKAASTIDRTLARGKSSGNASEVIADGTYGDITGFERIRVTNEETKKTETRLHVTLSDGRKVDIANVKGLNQGQAQVLQFLQNDGGRSIGTNTAMAMMQMAANNKNMAGTVTDAMRIIWSERLEQKAPKTNLDTATENAIRQAVRNDINAAEEARLRNRTEVKPGQGRTVYNGKVFGTQAFSDSLKGLDENVRNEALTIASIAKSAGFNVELYYDTKDSGNQGSYMGGRGIRINLAGTFNKEGAHRSAVATFAHEIIHNLEANSKEAYKALRSFVLRSLAKNGFNLQQELQTIMDNYRANGEDLDLNGAIAEIVAKGCEQVLTNEKVLRQLKEEDPSLYGKVKKAVRKLIARIQGVKGDAMATSSMYARALMNVTEEIGNYFMEAYREAQGAQGAQGVAEGTGTAEYSFMGTDPETGKSVYMSNFGNNVQNDNKRYHIVKLVRKVFSQQPISLTIKENGVEKQIQAQFNPDFDYTLKRDTDLLKLAFKNKMGSPHERTVMLNLADDYYQILQEASYDNWQPNKKDRLIPQANRWLYFVDDIYYAEKDSDVMDPYRITINIREANDGHFVYSYSAEKQEGQQKKLSVPIIRSGSDGTKSGELTQPSDNIVSRTEAERKSQKSFQDDQDALQADIEESSGPETHYGDHAQFSLRVTDQDELDFLNRQETVKTYKSMQLIDGKLYPPMAAVVAGGMEDHSELGQWEKATEHPELIKKGNKFTLNKGKGKGSLDAAYNPYMHSSNLMINDQFSGAYNRPNLVTVECEVPVSELTSGYHAEFAKDSVGWHSWHTGPVAGQLRKQKGQERQVMLSRWIKPVRIVDNAEVAQHYADLLKGTDIAVPDNVVTPALKEELIKAGVKIEESGRVQHSFKEDQGYMAAVKAGDMETAQRMVDEKAETVFAGSKVRGTDGKLLKMYHGTGAEFNEFRRDMIGSTGRFEGSGFNFTPYEGRAASYGKNVLAGYLNIQNPLSAEKKTLTVSKLAKLIRETDPTGDNIISDYARETRDYGKPSFISRESITAARALWEASDSDVDIYSFISAADSDAEGLIAAFEKLGYDGLIHYSDDGKIKTAVAFSSEQFKRADPVTYDDNGKEIPLSERFNTEKKDIRYSMQEDEEKYQAAVDAGDMKSAAKMVENAAKQNGYTMKVYHGTPTGGFTVFRDWSYFTENKDYADRYQNASASSIRGSYETTNPMTYALYMNPGKVFDTRKPAAAKLYNEARMEYGLGELSNTDSGLPDWTDGRDIIEFIEDRGLDYDTILLDEGGDPGENGPTKRGISYVTRANNVKNADPVTYDSKGKVVKLSERFNRKSNNIQFSMQEPVEVNKAGLIAVHNLTERQLMATIDEGGFTAASIAVVLAKMGHSKFGPISAVFKPSAIDPNQSAKNRIYGADAFTPTRYNAKVHTKLINKGEQAVRQELQSVLKKVDESLRNEAFRWLSEKAYGEYTDESIEEWAEKAYNNVGMLAAYQADHGAEVKLSEKNVAAGIAKKERKDKYDAMFNGLYDAGKFDEFWDDIEKGDNRKEKINKYGELLAGIIPEIAESWNQYKETQKGTIGIRIWNWIEEFKDYMKYGFKETSVKDLYETRADLQKIVNEADFNEWFIDKFSRMFGEKGIWKNVDPFTASGESKSFRQTHLPYSAENVVRAMYNNVDRKGVSAYGASGLIASASKEYANLDEVRKDTARLKLLDDEEYSKLVDELDAKMNDLAREISPDYPVGGMDAMIEAGKAYARNQSAAALKRAFAAQDFKLTDAQIAKAKELMDLAREFPTGYFEAKPERVSGFDELYKIIIPENAGDKMFRKLEENNIPYETYNGTEEDRLRILNEQTDAQFSFMDETDVDARAWMETVNENSLQTEAEKQLLRNFKSLRMRVSLKQEQERKIQEEIKRLQGVLNGNEGKGEETGAEIISMVEALKSVGINVKYTKNGKWLMLGGLYNGTRIGKLAGKNKITLQRASEAVKMKLQDLGFTYDNVTLMWEYPNRTRKTMGNTEIERQLNTLETRLEKATREKQVAQDELAKITSSNGYASIMYRQQRVLNDFVYGRTQDEVRGAVDRLEKSAANIAKRIEDETKKAQEQEKNKAVQQFLEIIGTTTIDQTAATLKKRYNSTWTKNQLKVYLEPIILKMKAGEDFESDVETLAGILVNSDSTNTYEELSGLRGLVITLGPGAQKELRASNSSLKEIRARLAGTGIQVKFGERSSLESDIEDLRAEYPSIPELGDEKDALENFVRWVEGMKSQSAANEFYEQRIAEAMAVITQQAAGTAKGIYMPTDPKAAKQVLAMVEFVKTLSAETQAAQKMLQDVAKDMEELQKAGRQASGMAVTLTHDATTAIDYFNRMARIAQDQAKQKTRKDLIEQLKSDFAQKVAKNNEEWRNLIERDAQARKQMEKNMSSRGQINTVVKRLYDLLKNPKGTRNIPEHMQGLAREIIGVIVENDLSEMKHKISRIDKKNLMEAQRVLQAWEARDGKFNMADLTDMDPENASMLVINQDLQQIYDGIEKFNQEIRGKNKLDTLQQRGEILTQIQEAMSEIYTAIRAEGEVFLRGRKVATEDAAAEVMNGTGGKKYREWTGTAGRALAGMHKAIVSGNMTPEYFFRTIGNKGLNDLWENYHAAENRNGLELAKAKARLDEIAKKYGYDKWDTKERRTVHLMNGDVQMTLGQIMALWATWNRENTLGPEMSNHLTGGGFYVEQQDLRDGLLGRTTVQKKAIKLAETDMETGYNPDVAALESLMTQEQKDYVNDIVQFMSSDMSALGNEASMAAYGIRMYKEKYYFPFQMWDGIKSRKSNEAAQGANVDRAFHPSFSKSRMHGANNALVIGDFTQTAADHVAGMINYATMGLANESLQKVLNQQVQEGGELDQTKRNIRVILEEAYGQEAMQYLLELQRQLNGGAVRTSKSLGDKAISLFRKNAVAGSLSVALQQPLSYIRAAVMVNPKYLAAALNPATWKGSYQEMMAHSGVAVIKDMGRFDMNAGQSAREYLTPDELEGKAAKIWGQITDKATILPEMMDRMTWTRMWSACKAEQAALHPEMDVKSDEFLDMVGERFNDLMRRTQVYDSVLVKSANMRSDNYWVKSLTSFMAEPTLTLNVLADAMREAKGGTKGGKALLAKAGATFILSAAMQAFFKGIMGSGRNPDEKKTWDENFLYRFWSNFINEADPVQLIPGYNDLVTLLKDGELEDDAMGALGKLFTAGKGTIDVLLGNGNKGVYRDLEDSVGQLVQLFTNLPAKNIMRDARAMYNFIAQPYAKRPTSASVLLNQTKDVAANADNMLGVINKWLGDAGYQTSNTAYYQRIYQAKKEGNEKAAQSMIDYLLTGKGVTEKAISSGINSAAKKDESASAAETADFLINEGSTSADDYVTDQLKAGSITAEEARKLLKQADPEKSDDDIWWTVDRIEYMQGTGAESISGKYYRLWDAMDANKADEIGDAVRIMTSHGVDAKNIKGQIGSHYKQAYLDGDSTAKRTIRDAMQKAYRKLGFTAEDANKTISNWEKKK